MNSVKKYLPVHFLNWSYDRIMPAPQVRNQNLIEVLESMHDAWASNIAKPNVKSYVQTIQSRKWEDEANDLLSSTKRDGYNENSILEFNDGVFGPTAMAFRTAKERFMFNELEEYRAICPTHDWEKILKQRYASNYKITREKMIRIEYQQAVIDKPKQAAMQMIDLTLEYSCEAGDSTPETVPQGETVQLDLNCDLLGDLDSDD